jgi:GNAT superfamily N-acetyltransferase
LATDELLTARELAAELKVAMRTLERWRRAGTGPPFSRFDHTVRYRRSDVDAYETPPSSNHRGAKQVVETVTFMEMTSPEQLRPSRRAPAPMSMDKVDVASASLLRSTFDRVGAPYNWPSRRTGPDAWSDERWRARLLQPGVHAWTPKVDSEIAGMVELQVQRGGEVEITVLGLVPEFIGKGFGGHLLTIATSLAWEAEPLGGVPIQRLWLHTSSLDHPHAMPNYLGRGFRKVRNERRSREIPP